MLTDSLTLLLQSDSENELPLTELIEQLITSHPQANEQLRATTRSQVRKHYSRSRRDLTDMPPHTYYLQVIILITKFCSIITIIINL